VQAYVSPPIAAVFLFGLLWKRINGQGAIASLLVGFALGAARFILEIVYAGQQLSGPLAGFLEFYVRMNFLHFAVFMFVICLAVLIIVSLLTPAPAASKVAGLTFQTIREKITMHEVERESILQAPAEAETATQRKINLALAGILIATVISLWIYFA
jgi:SSS family solute:Na+ symporter